MHKMRTRLLTLMTALVLLLTTMVCVAAAEEADGPAWTFPVAAEDIRADDIALASAAAPLASDYVPVQLMALTSRRDTDEGSNINGGVYMASNQKVELVKRAYNALTKMIGAAEVQQVTLYVRQGYRSYEDQERRYAQAEKKGDTSAVQKAGECDFQTGLAVTVVGKEWRTKTLTDAFATSPEGQWLLSNCARYGFVLRYPQGKEATTGYAYEPWHLRYVGTEIATYMTQNNLCLEEFCAEFTQNYEAYKQAGGALEIGAAAVPLPAGPVVLDACGPDGDHDISLFHD